MEDVSTQTNIFADLDLGYMAKEAEAYLARLAARDPEIMAGYKERRDLVSNTFLQNWPQSLTDISIPQAGFELTDLERRALIGALMARDGEEPQDPRAIQDGLISLKSRLAPLIATFPEGAFVRLGSRSPKDSWEGMRNGFRVTDAERALQLLLDSMERIADDLSTDDYAGAASWIFVRAWREMPAWTEFRCFMKDRKLVAIGQYDCQSETVHPEIAQAADSVREAVIRFFETRFVGACHLDDVVFDVFVTPTQDGFEATLLEINPFAPGLTYPGAFSWSEVMASDESATQFRYLT